MPSSTVLGARDGCGVSVIPLNYVRSAVEGACGMGKLSVEFIKSV